MSGHLVLVVNTGSSSLKFQLIDPRDGAVLSKGLVERVTDHREALATALAAIREDVPGLSDDDLLAVGHRVVHGGSRFADPVIVDDAVLTAVQDLVPLAPLHNPANLEGLRATMAAFPDVPQVAVFDTAFHQSMPPSAYTYAVPSAWREDLGVRRYGFHGTSVAYVTARTAELLGRPVTDLNLVVAHLGNGASMTAVLAGRSIDTSMGLSPLEGLVMGTRSGDVDPALGGYLARTAGLDEAAYDAALNGQSGLLGLSGVSDFRELLERRQQGDPAAALAYDVVVHRLVKYVGAYAAELGRVDAIVFTGGIGERSAVLRADVLTRLGILGIQLDADANAAAHGEVRITTPASHVAAWVVPTNEELQIAREAAALVAADR